MITYAIIHVLLGILGAIIVTKLDLNKGHDFTLIDLLASVFGVILTGPVLFASSLLYASGEQPSIVLIKGKKK